MNEFIRLTQEAIEWSKNAHTRITVRRLKRLKTQVHTHVA